MNPLVSLVALGALAIANASAGAAEMRKLTPPGYDVTLVMVEGEIERGDGERFVDAIEGERRATVILGGPGGSLTEALRIGAEIRTRNFATMVLPDVGCHSACALIWISGARRYLSNSSRIGFHAVYSDQGGDLRESGMGNAEVGSFLTHLGLRIEAIRYLTMAGPTKVKLLTPHLARQLGIEVYEQDGLEVTTPGEAPTVDVHARNFVGFSLLKSRCGPYLSPDPQTVDAGIARAFQAGLNLVGDHEWPNRWGPFLDVMKSQISAQGPLSVCLEVEKALRGQGYLTGIVGPSFDCRKAMSDTEKAVCLSPDLWAEDRIMGAIYSWLRANVDDDVRRRISGIQKEWLRRRNACGGDVQCLNDIYRSRLQEMRSVELPFLR